MQAASELGLAVVVVDRPPSPVGVEVVDNAAAARAWVEARAAAG